MLWSSEKLSVELAELFEDRLQAVSKSLMWSSEVVATIQTANALLLQGKPGKVCLVKIPDKDYLKFHFETWENNGSHYSGWYDSPLPEKYVKYLTSLNVETRRAYLIFQIALIVGAPDLTSIQKMREKLLLEVGAALDQIEEGARKALSVKLAEVEGHRKDLREVLG